MYTQHADLNPLQYKLHYPTTNTVKIWLATLATNHDGNIEYLQYRPHKVNFLVSHPHLCLKILMPPYHILLVKIVSYW